MTSLVNIGLDFDKAYNQPKPVFKVRHLKAGIRLSETLSRFGEEINLQLIKSINLQHKLLDLYDKEYIALSVKLAILKALDTSLNYGSGVEQFLTSSNGVNGYQRLIGIFRNTRPARVRYSLTNIFRKLHLYEVLENLYAVTTIDVKNTGRMAEEVENAALYLEETLRYLREAPILICQPVRFLPVCSRFEFPNNNEANFAVFSYFRHFGLLDILLTNMTIPELIAHPGVVSCVLEILAELLDTEDGMLFLVSEVSVTNRILKLLSSTDDQYSISPQLGLHMAHRLYVLNLADGFRYKWKVEQTTDIDNAQLLDVLSSLFNLTFTILGRHAVTHVLSRGDIIKSFLKALQCSRSSGRERRKSPGKAFISDLMWMVIRCSDYIPFLERHRSDLIEVGSWQSDSNNSSWLNPVRNESCFSYNDVTDLCDYLKRHTEKAILYPGELITAVRLLRHLALPVARKCSDEEESVELKYKFVLIQLFSQEGLTYLTSILHKICNHYERPHLHAYTLAGKEGSAMISLVMPAVQLVRVLVDYVVRCRDVEFKDLTAVPALLKTYSLMFYITQTSLIHLEAVETMKEIVETLLAYTQTVAIEPLNDSRSLNKSLWTLMMAEVLKFTSSLPEMFVPCLSLLSELLPLPFPIQTRNPLSEAEVLLATNSRKLWSAHLLPLDNLLQDLISTLCYSSYQPLLQLLKRVCIQLADLGPPTALVVTRSILSSLWSEIGNSERLTSRSVRLLNVLACLLNHSALKMTVIQITTGSSKSDEIFAEFWSTLLAYLSYNCDNNVYHVQGQECILSMIQALCDIEISLYPPPSQAVPLEVYLSNSLPPKNLFRIACDALVKHAENSSNAFTTIAVAIRTCATLTEYDYGIYRLKICLSEHSNALYNIVNKLVTEWNKENADCLNCLSNLLDFVKECAPRDNPPDSVNLRTLSVSYVELAALLKWNVERGEGEKHPLEQMNALLLECTADEDIFQSMRANLSSLIGMLNNAGSTECLENAAIELILDPPEPLLTQFQSRPVFVVGDIEDERLSVAYWLSVAPLDDIDQDAEQVRVATVPD